MKKKVFAAVVISILCLTVSIKGQEAKPGEVEVKYDRFKDSTLISIEPIPLFGTERNGLELSVVYGFSGQTPPATKTLIGFQFFSMSDRQKFALDRELIFLVDGERVRVGAMSLDTATVINGVVFEAMHIGMSYSTFSKLANGKKVEGQVGATEFELKTEHLKSLREFASRM